jgi:type IV secretion system protein VirD4
MNNSSSGIMIGRDEHAWVWSGAQRSCLALGPTRSGKTSSLIIPNVLCAPGSVVVTSTKQDVLDATLRTRKQAGTCYLFDPLNTVIAPPGVERIHWSPLHRARSWDGALLAANAMVATSRLSGAAREDHWSERAGALLACLLHAAALEELEMKTVTSWVDRRHLGEALATLDTRRGDHPSRDLLAGIMATDPRELSGIFSTTSGTLSVYRAEVVRSVGDASALDARDFAASHDTLYICASSGSQRLLAPLIVGMITDISEAIFERDQAVPHSLFALDELANIAPLPDLPRLISEGAGQGLLILGCLQDLSQARGRWGSIADGFVSLFSTTVVLPGIADRSTLELIESLGGQALVPRRSWTHGLHGRRETSVSDSFALEARFPASRTAQGEEGRALVIDANNSIGFVSLSPAYRDQPWKDLIEGPARVERDSVVEYRDDAREQGRVAPPPIARNARGR